MAGKSIYLILTRAAMLTENTITFIDVRLTTSICNANRTLKNNLYADSHKFHISQTSHFDTSIRVNNSVSRDSWECAYLFLIVGSLYVANDL